MVAMDDESSEMELKKAKVKPVTVTVPFKADFVGTYMAGTGPNSECGECPTDANGVPIGPECWGIVINDDEEQVLTSANLLITSSFVSNLSVEFIRGQPDIWKPGLSLPMVINYLLPVQVRF